MNTNEGDKKHPININRLVPVVSGSSTILSPQAAKLAIDAQRALDKQREMLSKFNEDMNKKRPTNVLPGDEERRKRLKTFLDSEPQDGRRKTITVTTKCITDPDGHVTTVKTTEEVIRPTVTASALRQSQSTLSVYGFSG